MPALPATIWLLFAAAMIISSIGFKNYVWFISLGYGFSIAGEGILMLLLYGKELTIGTIICCVLFIIYGCRLGGYLAIREFLKKEYSTQIVYPNMYDIFNALKATSFKDTKVVILGMNSCYYLYLDNIKVYIKN